MKADKTSLELAIIEAYAHLEDSKPSPTDGGTTFSRFSNGERNWTVPVTLVPLGGRLAAHIDCPAHLRGAAGPPAKIRASSATTTTRASSTPASAPARAAKITSSAPSPPKKKEA